MIGEGWIGMDLNSSEDNLPAFPWRNWVSGPIVEPGTSRIRNKSAHNLTTTFGGPFWRRLTDFDVSFVLSKGYVRLVPTKVKFWNLFAVTYYLPRMPDASSNSVMKLSCRLIRPVPYNVINNACTIWCVSCWRN